MRRASLILLICAAAARCDKVPIVDIQASFTLADASWFEDEQTLFVFYRVTAEQGLGPASQIELTYRTDDVVLPWTRASALPTVHAHVPVDCGATGRCGSLSLHVAKVPREVGLRLRYHEEGALTLDAPVTFNVIGSGPAFSHRSLLVYGVFDEANGHVQWRARHKFPTLRNEEVQALGLRRYFSVSGRESGTVGAPPADNPYGYAFAASCPAGMTPLPPATLETSERAIFEPDALPLAASSEPAVCAVSTVTDATGTFQATALAFKNPEVRPAFPALHSPIRLDTRVPFLLRICDRTLSAEHLAMQRQRLLLDGAVEVCLDGWRDGTFADQLASILSARVDEVRAQGNDMVLTLVLHHDDPTGALAATVEAALVRLLPAERDKSSPRVSGAFVFDSYQHAIARAEIRSLALWCPALFIEGDLDQIPILGQTTCAVMPDQPDVRIGPFRFNSLPILPTREQYLTFVAKYSEAQAGQMKDLQFRAPERTPLSENVPLGDFGVVTFFNDELFTAAPTDAFSYCASGEGPAPVMFRTAADPVPQPLWALPDAHAGAPQATYELGIAWQFPYLLRLQYETVVAGAATAYSFTVPFGVGVQSEAYSGTALWTRTQFPIGDELLQCTRFCDHPTFDSAGVYQVGAGFRVAYADQCYRPAFPELGDGGFPRDP